MLVLALVIFLLYLQHGKNEEIVIKKTIKKTNTVLKNHLAFLELLLLYFAVTSNQFVKEPDIVSRSISSVKSGECAHT